MHQLFIKNIYSQIKLIESRTEHLQNPRTMICIGHMSTTSLKTIGNIVHTTFFFYLFWLGK